MTNLQWARTWTAALALVMSFFGSLIAHAADTCRPIPGYTGPLPLVPELEGKDRLLAALNAAASSEQRQHVMEDNRRRAAPYFILGSDSLGVDGY
jgi:hypothetical protein